MTDDDILFLWTLNGSWGWQQLSEFIHLGIAAKQWHDHPLTCMLPYYLTFRYNVKTNFIVFYSPPEYMMEMKEFEGMEKLYHVVDVLTFLPSETWLKLLLAKRWFKDHNEQFT